MTNQPCFWPGGPKQPLPRSSGPGQMLHKYLSPGGATHILTIHLCVAPLGLDRYSPDNLRCLTAPARVVTALRACSTDSRATCGRNTNGIDTVLPKTEFLSRHTTSRFFPNIE